MFGDPLAPIRQRSSAKPGSSLAIREMSPQPRSFSGSKRSLTIYPSGPCQSGYLSQIGFVSLAAHKAACLAAASPAAGIDCRCVSYATGRFACWRRSPWLISSLKPYWGKPTVRILEGEEETYARKPIDRNMARLLSTRQSSRRTLRTTFRRCNICTMN